MNESFVVVVPAIVQRSHDGLLNKLLRLKTDAAPIFIISASSFAVPYTNLQTKALRPSDGWTTQNLNVK